MFLCAYTSTLGVKLLVATLRQPQPPSLRPILYAWLATIAQVTNCLWRRPAGADTSTPIHWLW